MGYPQAPTLLLCDNQCAVGLATVVLMAKERKEGRGAEVLVTGESRS